MDHAIICLSLFSNFIWKFTPNHLKKKTLRVLGCTIDSKLRRLWNSVYQRQLKSFFTWGRENEGGLGVTPKRNLSRFERPFDEEDHHHIISSLFLLLGSISCWDQIFMHNQSTQKFGNVLTSQSSLISPNMAKLYSNSQPELFLKKTEPTKEREGFFQKSKLPIWETKWESENWGFFLNRILLLSMETEKLKWKLNKTWFVFNGRRKTKKRTKRFFSLFHSLWSFFYLLAI